MTNIGSRTTQPGRHEHWIPLAADFWTRPISLRASTPWQGWPIWRPLAAPVGANCQSHCYSDSHQDSILPVTVVPSANWELARMACQSMTLGMISTVTETTQYYVLLLWNYLGSSGILRKFIFWAYESIWLAYEFHKFLHMNGIWLACTWRMKHDFVWQVYIWLTPVLGFSTNMLYDWQIHDMCCHEYFCLNQAYATCLTCASKLKYSLQLNHCYCQWDAVVHRFWVANPRPKFSRKKKPDENFA